MKDKITYFRQVQHCEGVRPLTSPKDPPYSWAFQLKQLHAKINQEDFKFSGSVLPASVFHHPTLSEFVNVIEEGLKVNEGASLLIQIRLIF